MPCAYRCHEIGGPWIAENPDCPIHGHNGVQEDLNQLDEMKSVIAQLCFVLEGYLNPNHTSATELINHARTMIG